MTTLNTVPFGPNQKLHDEAVHLMQEMQRAKSEETAQQTNKSYNQRRKDAKAKLKPVLDAIWKKFEDGETVGGYSGKKEWCKKTGYFTYQWCNRIVSGGDSNASKKRKSLSLEVGVVVKVDKISITLTAEMIQSILKLRRQEQIKAEKQAKAKSLEFICAVCNKPNDEKHTLNHSPVRPKAKAKKPVKVNYKETLKSLGDHTFTQLSGEMVTLLKTHNRNAIRMLYRKLNGEGDLTWNKMLASRNQLHPTAQQVADALKKLNAEGEKALEEVHSVADS